MKAKYRILTHPGGIYEVQRKFLGLWWMIDYTLTRERAERLVEDKADSVYVLAEYDKDGKKL